MSIWSCTAWDAQSMGRIRKIPPHLTWHPLANLLAAQSWASKNANCPPFQSKFHTWKMKKISTKSCWGVIQHPSCISKEVQMWLHRDFRLNIYTYTKRIIWQLERGKDGLQDQFHHQNSIDYQGAMVTKYDSCPRRAKALATWLAVRHEQT